MTESDRERLESVHRGIQRSLKCRLHESRTHAVPGEGATDARCMFIGEAPGAKRSGGSPPRQPSHNRQLPQASAA